MDDLFQLHPGEKPFPGMTTRYSMMGGEDYDAYVVGVYQSSPDGKFYNATFLWYPYKTADGATDRSKWSYGIAQYSVEKGGGVGTPCGPPFPLGGR